MIFKHFLPALLTGSILGGLNPVAAYAQSVDYTTLEQVFGEPITASVTGKPQRASEVPGDLTIITQDDIRRSGADNIPDILRYVTGIDIRHYGVGDSEVGIRGYNSPFNPRLLVMVDGRQIYADDNGRVGWNAIPVQLAEIRQIEVVKGPNSALFGFNAASGVINIITFDPLLDKVNSATIQMGTQNFGAANVVGTAHLGETAGLRISAGGWRASQYSGASGVAAGMPSPRYASVNVDGRWQAAPGLLLRASGGQMDSHAPDFLPTGTYFALQNRTSYLRVGGSAETRLGSIDLDIYRNMSMYKYNEDRLLNDVFVTKLSDLVKLNSSNTIRLGLEYRNNRGSGPVFGGALSYDVFSASGLWDWQIDPRWNLTNGVRFDHLVMAYSGTLLPIAGRTSALYNSTTITEPSFNSGIVYKVTDQDTIRLTGARGLKVPSLLTLGLQVTSVGAFTIIGEPTILPTVVWNTELAYDRIIAPLDATLTTAVFYQRNENLQATAGTGPTTFSSAGPINSSANIGSSSEVGFELGLRGKTDGGFRWNASYRLSSISDDINAASKAAPNTLSRFDNGTPQHVVIVGAGYTKGPWELDVAARWQSRFTDYRTVGFGFQPVYTADYISLNGRVAYQVTENLTLALVGQQYDVSAVLKPTGSLTERRVIASATAHF